MSGIEFFFVLSGVVSVTLQVFRVMEWIERG